MNKLVIAVSACTVTLVAFSPAAAQQKIQATRGVASTDDTLIVSRQKLSKPAQRLRVANLGSLTVQTGDDSTQTVRAIVVESFREQDEFAKRMNRAELVSTGALAAQPEIDDEVLVFDDAYVVRRSTTIIVKDPKRIAQASPLFRNYIGQRAQRSPQRAIVQAVELDAEERAGMQSFMTTGQRDLHPDDPIRAAAARGEKALLAAIEEGLGELTVEDTLIIPKVAGIDQGANIRIPTVRDGVLDLKNPVPAKTLSIKGLAAKPAAEKLALSPIEATPAPQQKPKRAPSQPKLESSGKEKVTAEFLLGITRAANFQWERKWTYTSGYFRLTLGAGYVFGYRVPVVATATVEPTRGYIRDYSDKKVIIGAAASIKTANGNSAFYQRAGLQGNQVQGGDELLLEANVGYGYRFKAFWKTIRYRPYTAIGLSYSQSFKPPMTMSNTSTDFGIDLDPKTTKISYDGTFVSGSASIRFKGKTWGELDMNLQTLVDNKTQKTVALDPNKMTQAGAYPYKLRLDPVPLRQGTTTQTRPFGVRFVNPEYKGRIIIVPGVRFSFGVGYKRLKRTFSTSWINLANLTIDTKNVTLKRHAGTRSEFTWNKGEKIYRKLDKPPSPPGRVKT